MASNAKPPETNPEEKGATAENGSGSSTSWDPMYDNFASALNLNVAGALTSAEGLLPIKGSFCEFADEKGECYKGSRCPHEHHVPTQVLNENPKMVYAAEEGIPVAHFNCLPFKESMHTGGFYQGRLVSLDSPENFYVALKSGPKCISEIKQRDMRKNKFADLFCEMNEFYSKYDMKNASSFEVRELVAVKWNNKGWEGFFRGTVTEEIVLDSDKLPDVPCYLIDLGVNVVCKMNHLAPLNPRFLVEPPMAYRCQLYGISPLFLHYSKTICQKFLELVNGKDCLIICRQRSSSTGQDLTEQHPNLVEIRAKVAPHTYINVKDELVKTKRVLKWNSNIYHPAAWEGMTDLEVDVLYDNPSTFHGHFSDCDKQEAKAYLKHIFKELADPDEKAQDEEDDEKNRRLDRSGGSSNETVCGDSAGNGALDTLSELS